MKTEQRELSYFRSLLEKYLGEHHPDKATDLAFIESRAAEALDVYVMYVASGVAHLEAEALANETLFAGLHFSKYDTIIEVLWNEFADEIPQGLAERLGAILLGNTAVQKVFARYDIGDNFDGKPEYDSLYTELTGIIQMVIDRNELPMVK